jgi:hypothetical protein
MKQLTISSKRYPGLGAPVPQVPGAPPGTKGSFTFAVGVAYEVADETAIAVTDLLNRMEHRVRRHYQLTVHDLTPALVVADAIASPTAPPVKDADPEPTPLVLTDDDRALIGVEVGKLKGLTVTQATPLIENTALNEDLPIELRRAYLQAVIETKNAKALDKLAQDLLDTLAS